METLKEKYEEAYYEYVEARDSRPRNWPLIRVKYKAMIEAAAKATNK
jgi:hypothetical protein